MSVVRARYYDGRRSVGHAVDLEITDQRLVARGEGVHVDEPIGAVRIAPALGDTRRLVTFSTGATCEVIDLDRTPFEQMIAAAGISASRVERWDRSWPHAAGAVAGLLLIFLLLYRFGAPALADSAATRLPQSALDQVSRRTLGLLDQAMLHESRLSEGRRLGLRSYSQGRLRLPEAEGTRPLTLEFRSSDELGPNALALPDGTVIMTDQLVELAERDDELLGVLAHEAGHVHHRHAMQKILRASIIGLFFTVYAGDTGFIAIMAPTALVQAKYSRDLERAADDYAIEVLQASGVPVEAYAAILQRLEDNRRERGGAVDDSGLAYLSSHPATADRIARLRAAGSTPPPPDVR
jgi:Zn-dependent protease with chaperone function